MEKHPDLTENEIISKWFRQLYQIIYFCGIFDFIVMVFSFASYSVCFYCSMSTIAKSDERRVCVDMSREHLFILAAIKYFDSGNLSAGDIIMSTGFVVNREF